MKSIIIILLAAICFTSCKQLESNTHFNIYGITDGKNKTEFVTKHTFKIGQTLLFKGTKVKVLYLVHY